LEVSPTCALLEHLDELTVEVDQAAAKVRVYCE